MRLPKLLMVLLAFSIAGGLAFASGSSESQKSQGKSVVDVQWYNSIGAYRALLQTLVQKWNQTTGAKEGVRIVMTSNIDNYASVGTAMMQAGKFPDIVDAYLHLNWIKAGWIRNLYKVQGTQDLIKEYKPYMVQGINLQGDFLVGLPYEVVPLKFVYNADLFAKSGLSGCPATWSEVVKDAKIITQNGKGKYYGFGWTSKWQISFRRLAFLSTISSTGVGFFNNNTAKYDFTPFKPVVEALRQMYKDGSMFPTPLDQAIDPIRNDFAQGLVGMEPAPSYDDTVYNLQFPAKFNWKVCDVPAYTSAGPKYKGIYLPRANVSITTHVPASKMPAVVKAWQFINSDQLLAELYSNSAIIPANPKIIEMVKNKMGFKKKLVNWGVMSDITHYYPEPPFPDTLLSIKPGEGYQTVFTNIMLGNTTWDAQIKALNARYNAAYQKAKSQGRIDTKIYEQPWHDQPWNSK